MEEDIEIVVKEKEPKKGPDKNNIYAMILCAVIALLIVLIAVKLADISKDNRKEDNKPASAVTAIPEKEPENTATKAPETTPEITETPTSKPAKEPTTAPTEAPTPVPTATPDHSKAIKKKVEAEINSEPDSYPFLNSEYEGSVNDIHYKSVPDMKTLGEKNVVICAVIDGVYGETEAILNVVDTTPPVINGVEDTTIYMDYTYEYAKGITVTDNSGEKIQVSVDSSAVDLGKIGDYDVIYKAKDSSGNETTVIGKLHITPNPENATEEMANEKADEILAKIIKTEMTDVEKCTAIYKYIKKNMGYYSGHKYTEEYKCAYLGMTLYYGDYYVYYCYAKILFDRLGFENMMVSGTNGTHCWNLVKVNGEWYHFDTTPRNSGGEFCLLTDAEIKAYSEANGGTHVYDSELYPESATESLGIVPKIK